MPHYEFVVDGTLGEEITSAFPELTATTRSRMTVLSGVLASTEALRQVLVRMESFGLGLNSMRIIDSDDEVRSGDTPASTA